MKRIYFALLTILAASLLLAGSAIGSGQYKHGSTTSAATMETSKAEAVVPSLNSEQIRELQRLLIERGYKVGTTDGVIGEGTTAAIKQFQTDKGLVVNGIPDQVTLRALAPDLKRQEFFGVAPAYGEPEPMKKGY